MNTTLRMAIVYISAWCAEGNCRWQRHQ